MPAEEIPEDSAVWEPVAHALGQLVHSLVLSTAPKRILMGGGVLASRPPLLAEVRRMALDSLNGYLDLERLTGSIVSYVQPPGLGTLAGPLGALALAGQAYAEKSPF
jgi:fructokinase